MLSRTNTMSSGMNVLHPEPDLSVSSTMNTMPLSTGMLVRNISPVSSWGVRATSSRMSSSPIFTLANRAVVVPLLVWVGCWGALVVGVASARGPFAAPRTPTTWRLQRRPAGFAFHTRIPASPRLAADTLAGWFWREA